MAFALEHPGEWTLAGLIRWIETKQGSPSRAQALDCLHRLEKPYLVECMAAGGRGKGPSRWRTRPALYGLAAPDLILYEQLLHPDGSPKDKGTGFG